VAKATRLCRVLNWTLKWKDAARQLAVALREALQLLGRWPRLHLREALQLLGRWPRLHLREAPHVLGWRPGLWEALHVWS